MPLEIKCTIMYIGDVEQSWIEVIEICLVSLWQKVKKDCHTKNDLKSGRMACYCE